MNLRIEKIEDKKSGDDFEIYFDGVVVGTASDNWAGEGKEFLIDFKTDILEISKEHNIGDFFKENIGAFMVPLNFSNFSNLSWNQTGLNDVWFDEEKISLFVLPDLVRWNKPYNIFNFLEKLKLLLLPYDFYVDFKDDKDFLQDGFNISTPINLEKEINEEYERFLSVINNEIKNLFDNPSVIDVNSVVSKFSFPQEIKETCEQYLIYFSRFLEDYGIEITSILESKNAETFFSVKPKNSTEALSNIRNLLNLYLSLPDIQNLENITKDYRDVSVQQLLSNIYHLKSQLILASSLIESKNATIESLKFSNFQKQNYIEENIIKNEEKTLDGLLSIQEFEYNGFKFNLPEIFRRLKRTFKK